MSEISAAMQELAHLEEKRHQQGLTPEEADHAEQLRAYLEQFQGVGGEAQAWAGGEDPNAQWPQSHDAWGQDPTAQWPQPAATGWQDPNAPWQQPAGGWEQDPNAQWPQPAADGWQDPNAQWPQQSAEGWQDPNAQWPQQSAEGWQDPNAQWPQQSAEGWQDPNAPWPQQAGEGWQDPNAPWQPSAEGLQDPDAQWPQQSAAGWQDPNAQWPQQSAEAWQDPNAQWPQQSAEAWQDPNAQWPQQSAEGWQDPNAPWPQQPGVGGWEGEAQAQWPSEGAGPQEASAPQWQQDGVGGGSEEPGPASQWQPTLEASASDEVPPRGDAPAPDAVPQPSVDAGSALPAEAPVPGPASESDPSHAWLDEGVDAAPSPWVTAPQAPSELPPPNVVRAEESSLDLGREVDLPALEAPPDWMNSPVPPSTGSSSRSMGAPLDLGAFDDPSAGSEEAEPSMEIASLSAPISTPVPDGDLALTKSLEAASTESPASAAGDEVVPDAADTSEVMDDEMEVSDADIIEVSDDDVTLIDDDEEEAPVASEPPAPAPVPTLAPRRPIRIAGGLGPTPAPAAATIIPRESSLPPVSPAWAGSGSATSASLPTAAPSVLASPSAWEAPPASLDAKDLGASAAPGVAEASSQSAADASTSVAAPMDAAAAAPAPAVQDPIQPEPALEADPLEAVAAWDLSEVDPDTGSEQAPPASSDAEVDPTQTGDALAQAAQEITASPGYGLAADDEAAATADADGDSSGMGVQEVTSDASAHSAPPETVAADVAGPVDVVASATVDSDAGEEAADAPHVSLSAPGEGAEARSPDVSSGAEPALADAESEVDAGATEAAQAGVGPEEGPGDPDPVEEFELELAEADVAPVQTGEREDASTEGAPEFGLPQAQRTAAAEERSGSQGDAGMAASPAISASSTLLDASGMSASEPRAAAEASGAAVSIPRPSTAEASGMASTLEAPSLDPLPIVASGSSNEGGVAAAADAAQARGLAPEWGPPPEAGAAPEQVGVQAPAEAVPEAVIELADDDASVPVLDLGDLTLASPIPDGESVQPAQGASDAAELPSEMFEPLEPEEAPVATMEPEPVAEIELAEDPRVLEVIAQPTEIELKEVALGDGVFGNTLEISELGLAEPEPEEGATGDEVAETSETSAVAAEAPAAASDDGDEVELELELSDVEPEPAETASGPNSGPDAGDDDFEVDLSDGDPEPAPGAYTPSTPPAIVTRFSAQDRLSASGHTPVHTERATSIPLPGAASTSSVDDTEDLPEAELELDLEEPAFEPEEVEASTSAEVEIELSDADAHFGAEHLPEPALEIELTEADAQRAGDALPEPSMAIELSDVAEPAPFAPLPEPTMEIELVEPEPPAPAPVAQVPAPQPVPASVPAAATEAWVTGEHRVILHTVEGHVLRGTLRNANLLAPEIPLELQPGQPPERVPASRAKAVFFMLSSGQPQPTPDGAKIRITFHDGRQVPGYATDHASDAAGFFVVPVDNRTNTARIFVYRSSIQAISPG